MKRVLVIDDAATVRMFCRVTLQGGGIQVEEAVNGIEGLEKAMQAPFDLYVVDVNMPKLDGYGFLRDYRRRFCDRLIHRHHCGSNRLRSGLSDGHRHRTISDSHVGEVHRL